MKKHSKKYPKIVWNQSLAKNGQFFAPHNVDYMVLRFHTLCDPSISSQIKELLSSNGLNLFKKTCFGYLLSLPTICMQNQAIHLLMKYELTKSNESYFSVQLKGETLNFRLREFALITSLRCVTQVTDFGYTPTYISKIMSSYFPNKLRVEKSYLKQIVTTRSWVNDEDAVKLCILYLLEFFICPSDKDHVSFVDHFRFYLVESGTDLSTRCSNSIPHILRWSATKGQIWLAAFEEKMIKHEWIKFTNIVESGEEIAVLILPEKIEYKVQEGEQTSEVLNADPPTLETKQTDGEEDKESIAEKISKLEKGIEQVDRKLEDFRKAVFVELDSLRVFINDSVQSVLQMINIRNVQDDAKHFQFNIGEQVQENTSKTVTEGINAQSPIHGVTVAAQSEQVIEEHDNEGADAQYVDLGDSEGSRVEKNGVTLDDFELPDNLSQLVMFGEPIQDDATPMHSGRIRHPKKYARSPFIPLYSSGGNNSVGPKIFYLKHPFTTVIGENIDPDILEKFNKWLYQSSDKGSKRKAPFSIKDNQIKPWLDLVVENVDKKEWFFSLAHPGQVLNDSCNCSYFVVYVEHYKINRSLKCRYNVDMIVDAVLRVCPITVELFLDIIVDIFVSVFVVNCSYNRQYGPNNKTRFTTTDCVFKTRIEQIYEKFINLPPQEKYSVIKPQDVVAEYILGYRLLANVAWDEVDYVIMPVNIKEKFHWVLVVFDIADRQLYAYDSMVSSHNHHVVESCVKKFSVIIPLYFSCTGFYGKRNDINFMNTKAYIEKPIIDPLNIQWMVADIP
ncbi:uncharacterized protein [Nicotiana sylvestris]|uniref:uncharacterized protein n=1 Tax=Nicotiana sylvestris TaxID=4096 RepID=UPI00388C4FD9